MSLAEDHRPLPPAPAIARTIADEVLQLAPFPHLVVPDLLAAEARRKVALYWPRESDFATCCDGHDRQPGDAGFFRLQVLGTAAGMATETMMPVARDFWRGEGAAMLREAAVALYRRYLPALRLRFGAALETLELETFAVLVNCYRRIAVRVHTDHPSFLYTAMVYLNGGATEAAGTSLYQPLLPGFTHEGCGFLERDDFERVRTLAFRDNQLVSFLKTADSFHGVEARPLAGPTQRCTINLHVRLTDACIARLYGAETARCLRERRSGATPVVTTALQRWHALSEFGGEAASEAELAPLLASFRIGETRI